MIKIERRPVQQNSKCEKCLHYDGNAAAKGGACEVGSQPYMCGDGEAPLMGNSPLDKMPVDGGPDLVIPVLVGQQGAMNEMGQMEPLVKMKTVALGDEHTQLAKRILGEMQKVKKSHCQMHQVMSNEQGTSSVHVPGSQLCTCEDVVMEDVAKAFHKNYLRPREQYKFSVEDIVEFLEKGAKTGASVQLRRRASRTPDMPTKKPTEFLSPTKKTPTKLPRKRSRGSVTETFTEPTTGMKIRHYAPKGPTKKSDLLEKGVKRKGGPGSRGGKIIGYTRSGKPVYAPSSKKGRAATLASTRAGKQKPDFVPSKGWWNSQVARMRAEVDTLRSHAQEHANKRHKDFTSEDHADASKLFHQTSLPQEQHALGVHLAAHHEEQAQGTKAEHIRQLKAKVEKKSELSEVIGLLEGK